MGAKIINFEPERCFECGGRGWTTVEWSAPASVYPTVETQTWRFTEPCSRCKGSGWE
jgi:hypothetical protein